MNSPEDRRESIDRIESAGDRISAAFMSKGRNSISFATGDLGGVAVPPTTLGVCLWKALDKEGMESLCLSCRDRCRDSRGGSRGSSGGPYVEEPFPTVLLRARNMLDKLRLRLRVSAVTGGGVEVMACVV